MSEPTKVLVVDDEAAIRRNIKALLSDLGYEVLVAADHREAMVLFCEERPNIVLTDLGMPQMGGLALIDAFKAASIATPIVVVSGTGTLVDAIEAIRHGAWDYVTKPVQDPSVLDLTIRRALERARLLSENEKYQKHLEEMVVASTQKLRESEARYRTLIDYAPEAIVVLDVDQDLSFIDVNENACQIFGHERPALLRLSPVAVSPPTQPGDIPSADAARTRVDEALAGLSPVFQWTHCKANGETFPCEVRLVKLPAQDRRLLRGSIVDISDRKRLEKQATELQQRLDQAQRLEAIGTLAGGIAHDFNNILGAIMGYTDLALMELPDDSPARALLENVVRGSSRAADLVRQILAFSRRSKQPQQPTQVALVAKEVLKLIRATLPATIAIHDRFDTFACVLADPGQLHQIIMNLCTNAGLAMREHGGTLELSLREREIDSASVTEHAELSPGHYVCLTVRDTGCGIPVEHLGRIFEPFFTTRAKGEGTGLGLSVVHGIVKGSGGTISVASEVGRGTTFDILLPVCEATAKVESAKTLASRGHERVLFVDDELDLTDVARQGLARFGYEVSAFNDPTEALAVFRARPSDFDVLVTDMTMPGLTGDALATEARRIRPEILVILVSGYSDRLTAEEAQAAGFDGFVDKPLRPTTLIHIIRKLRDRR